MLFLCKTSNYKYTNKRIYQLEQKHRIQNQSIQTRGASEINNGKRPRGSSQIPGLDKLSLPAHKPIHVDKTIMLIA